MGLFLIMKLQEMFDTLEWYDFECEGGPMINCFDYHKLKEYALKLEQNYNALLLKVYDH